ICALASGIVLVSYGIMTGNSISTVRALIMFIISVNAQVTGRRYDVITSASLAALLLLLQYPLYITSSGFLLSFGAVSGIIFVARALAGLLPEKSNKFIKKICMAFFSSFGVTVVTIPVIGCFFYQVSPYAVLLNIIVVPLMAVVMAGGVLGGLAAMVSQTLGMFFVGPACYILKLYMYLCDIVEKWPYHTAVTGCPKALNIVVYLIMIIAIYTMARKSKKSYLNILASVMATTAAILFLFAKKENDMAIHMLDVGQGQCILIENSGKFAMVDCGSSDINNCADIRVIPCLKYYGVSQLDSLFITHSDRDHSNGVDRLLEKVGVKKIFCGGMTDLNGKAVRLTAGMLLNWTDVAITICNPSPAGEYSDENAASLAFLLEKRGFSMLFTGDMDISSEKSTMEGQLLKKNITVLQVAHHGSKNSSGQEFIEFLKPKVSVISCGADNRYGHPHSETINRLTSTCTRIYRTDTGGEISIYPFEEKISQFAFFAE
ncbi:MAG: DNA internalization-related competence protein ComEC/Rec2, partial [Lachnospiraceae bacterium]